MVGLQPITITVRYEPGVRQGLSLAWIAPELEDAGLALTQEQLDAPMPSRTWVGSVDGRTFERFAESWVLPPKNKGQSASALDDGKDIVSYARTYDGMNWEVDGKSPIISVSVHFERPIWGHSRRRAPPRHAEVAIRRPAPFGVRRGDR